MSILREYKEYMIPQLSAYLLVFDHWTDEELHKLKKEHHTEHLHFHLVPRYDFDKDIRGEKVLLRKGGTGFEKIPGVDEKIYDLLDC